MYSLTNALARARRELAERLRAETELRESEQRVRTLFDAAQRQAQELKLLDRVRTALARQLDLPVLFRTVVEATAEIFGYTQVSLYLSDGDALWLQHQVGYDRVIARIPVTDGISGRVARTGQPILLADAQAEPGFLSAAEGITSEICVPLMDLGRVVGTLNVESVAGVTLTEADLRLVTALSEQVGIAIERARLNEAERQQAMELAQANEQLRQEIVERQRMEAALRQSEQRYALAARGANDGLWDIDLLTSEVYFSPRWKAMLGFAEDEVGSRLDDWFTRVHPDDLDEVKMKLAAHLDGALPHFENEHRLRHRDGSYRWVLSRGLAVRNAAGVPHRMAGSATDITERKRAEAQLLHDAFHDALTGLPNRALFVDRLEQAVRQTWRREGYGFAVLFLDLDRFKVVNDSLGHTTGDQLLVAIAQRLARILRAADTFARLGGDEFVILLDDVREAAEASIIAARLQEQLGLPFDLSGLEVVTSASIGIVLSGAGYERADDLLRDADIAMYRAKALGRARHEVFALSMRADALARLGWEADLRRALEREEFLVHYQPVVRLRTGRLFGFEALLRWQHPERGLILPGQFVPIAEDSGLIIAIDRWVMRAACRQLREWQGLFRLDPPLAVNVNLSSKHFTRPDLVEQIRQCLDEAGLGPASLRLEITESAIMENIDLATLILQQLHTLGVQIEIDDFGTGYSSLGYLVQLPADTLKIDRSFVSQMTDDAGKAEIVHTIVALAQNLRMSVIAEGIETHEQRAGLIALGCELGQGYLISRPVDSQAATAWIERQGPSADEAA
jgi:diguanylate cyclase (GGDEF)-like protein/PAS domain S-box-containing protein